MSDPLTNIEDAKAQRDLGAFAWRIYTGSRDDGATRADAFMIVVAWFLAMFKSNQSEEPS